MCTSIAWVDKINGFEVNCVLCVLIAIMLCGQPNKHKHKHKHKHKPLLASIPLKPKAESPSMAKTWRSGCTVAAAIAYLVCAWICVCIVLNIYTHFIYT